MKKLRGIVALLLVALMLSACASGESDEKKKKDAWDRDEAALAYTQTQFPNSELPLMEYAAIPPVAWVSYVETYEGVDVFCVAYEEVMTPRRVMEQTAYFALVRDGDAYKSCEDADILEQLSQRSSYCTESIAGKIVQYGDTCPTCEGSCYAGQAPEISDSQIATVEPDGSESVQIETVDPSYLETYTFATVDPDLMESYTFVTLDPSRYEDFEIVTIDPDSYVATEIIQGEISGVTTVYMYCQNCEGYGCEVIQKTCKNCSGTGLIIN